MNLAICVSVKGFEIGMKVKHLEAFILVEGEEFSFLVDRFRSDEVR